MKILIAYSTKSGTVGKCAERLAGYFTNCEVVLHDLASGIPDAGKYDFTILGSYIRRGAISKEAKQFVKENSDVLKFGRAAYFICCGYADSGEEYFIKNFPAELLNSAVIYLTFGGELNVKAQKGFFERLLMRIIVTDILDDGHNDGELKTTSLPSVLPENISRFADTVKRSFGKR